MTSLIFYVVGRRAGPLQTRDLTGIVSPAAFCRTLSGRSACLVYPFDLIGGNAY